MEGVAEEGMGEWLKKGDGGVAEEGGWGSG